MKFLTFLLLVPVVYCAVARDGRPNSSKKVLSLYHNTRRICDAINEQNSRIDVAKCQDYAAQAWTSCSVTNPEKRAEMSCLGSKMSEKYGTFARASVLSLDDDQRDVTIEDQIQVRQRIRHAPAGRSSTSAAGSLSDERARLTRSDAIPVEALTVKKRFGDKAKRGNVMAALICDRLNRDGADTDSNCQQFVTEASTDCGNDMACLRNTIAEQYGDRAGAAAVLLLEERAQRSSRTRQRNRDLSREETTFKTSDVRQYLREREVGDS